ncbi:MAG TPA: cytochrome c3 family protein [Opitutaceae bacterium]|nr:cytochrome c3 family protein [Opitutaceae bacterium]
MRSFLPPQILRLVLLAVGIVATYSVGRLLLTPKSFGEYGHYRGAALHELADRPRNFAGAKACDECHSDLRDKLAKAPHRGISCESCHGPANAHAANPDLALPKLTDAACLRCHLANPARPAWLKQIQPSKHYSGDDGCVGCHLPHQPNDSP